MVSVHKTALNTVVIPLVGVGFSYKFLRQLKIRNLRREG